MFTFFAKELELHNETDETYINCLLLKNDLISQACHASNLLQPLCILLVTSSLEQSTNHVDFTVYALWPKAS